MVELKLINLFLWVGITITCADDVMTFCLYLMNNMGINLITGFATALNLAYFTPKCLRWSWLHWGYGWSFFDSRNFWLHHFRILVICLRILLFFLDFAQLSQNRKWTTRSEGWILEKKRGNNKEGERESGAREETRRRVSFCSLSMAVERLYPD